MSSPDFLSDVVSSTADQLGASEVTLSVAAKAGEVISGIAELYQIDPATQKILAQGAEAGAIVTLEAHRQATGAPIPAGFTDRAILRKLDGILADEVTRTASQGGDHAA